MRSKFAAVLETKESLEQINEFNKHCHAHQKLILNNRLSQTRERLAFVICDQKYDWALPVRSMAVTHISRIAIPQQEPHTRIDPLLFWRLINF